MVGKLVLQEKYINIISEKKNLTAIYITRFDQEPDGIYFGFVIGESEMRE